MFWRNDQAVLQLRADVLSDSGPLQEFWSRWRTGITGGNLYGKIAT